MSTSRAVVVTGLPGGLWSEVAASLPGLEVRELDKLALVAGAPALAIVESPPQALARAANTDASLDVDVWHAQWAAAERQLLRLVLQSREHFIVIELDDLLRRRQAVAARLIEVTGQTLSWPEPAMTPTADPLLLASAYAAWQVQTSTRRVHDELLACCELLTGPPGADQTVAVPATAGAALAALWTLRQQAAAKSTLELDLAWERNSRAAIEKESAARSDALQQLQAQLQAAESKFRSLASQHDVAVASTHRLGESLATARAESGRTATTLEAERRRAADAEARHAQAEAERDALAFELGQTRTESEVALVQLAAATDVIESTQAELKQLRLSIREKAEAVRPGEVTIQELRVVHARDERPYREISLALYGVRFDEAPPRQGQVRLVEHHGQPGLAFFGAADQANLLSAWRESGREGDRRFMLLLPGDPALRGLTDGMDTADWLTVLAVADAALAHLREASAAQRAAWLPLAQRLKQLLAEVPPRLRTQGARLTPAPASEGGGFMLLLDHVSWGVMRLPSVALAWTPQSSGSVALLRGRDGQVPLSAWPDADDESLERLWLPVGTHRVAARSRPWAALPDSDRRFATALLQALPRLVEPLLGSLAPSSGAGAATLRQSAVALSQEAIERLEPLPIRELLPRMLRRAARRALGQR